MRKLFGKIALIATSVILAGLVQFGFNVAPAVAAGLYELEPSQYYITNFPSGLIYSKGWYGTFSYAPPTRDILLFDDDKGICVFTTAESDIPKGEQGGTSVKKVSQKEAEELVNSYSYDESRRPLDPEIKEILPSQAYFMGVWAGDKLKEKFDYAVNRTKIKIKDEITGEEKEVEKPLTEKQLLVKAGYEDAIKNRTPFDFAKYDPDRYAVMGQVFIVNGSGVITEAGRLVADATINVTTEGTFTFYMSSGTTCVLTSGTSAVSGSPKTLTLGSNAVTCTGTGTVDFNITVGTAANWSSVNSWSASSGGACGASVPTSADNAYHNANSYTAASQIFTVDATANCLNLNFSGATNSPTLALGNFVLNAYGARTFITAMTVTAGTGSITYKSASGTVEITNNAMPSYVPTIWNGAGTFHLADDQNCSSWTYTAGTFSANTATISINGTGAVALGSANYNGADFVLNGSTHTVSGAATGIDDFTRHPTSHLNTNSVTFTSGTTITCNNMTFDGGARNTQLLVQSTTLGTAATIHATTWTATNTDFMDITADTHLPNFSAQTDIGDCGGNTGITFPAATADQDYTADAGGNFSTAANWSGGRIPLAGIDNINITNTFNSGVTLTWDMPRLGKSINFSGMSWTGTATTVSYTTNIVLYGSLTTKTGVTWSAAGAGIELRGRSNYTLTSNGVTLSALLVKAPNGNYTLQDNTLFTGASVTFYNGGFDLNGKNTSAGSYALSGTASKTVLLGEGVITATGAAALTRWDFSITTGLTFNAETSTIVYSVTSANAQTFAGGGLTYNNVTVAGAGNYALTRTGNNTYNTFTVDTSAAAKTLISTGGSTQTVTNFVHTGTNTLTLDSTTATPVQWIKTGGGQIGVDYVSIANNTASPANTWFYGTHNAIGAGVTGWNAGAVSVISTTSSTVISSTSASMTGNVTEYTGFNPTIRGFEYDTDTGAPYALAFNETGTYSTGAYSLNATGLSKGTEYFFRAFATSAIGTGYGSELKFLTLPDEPTGLVLTQGDLSLNLTWTNGAGRGTTYIVGKVGGYPANTTDGTLIYNGTGTDYLHTPLNYGDVWYYRAWSRTDIDGMTSWSAAYSQATLGITGNLVVTTQAADTILSTSALLHGTLTNYGDSVTRRGFDYDVNSGAPYADNIDEGGTFATGVYSISLTGLAEGTEYFYRANATNVLGTAYGNEIKFLTRPGDVTSFNITAEDRAFNITWIIGAGSQNTTVWGKIGAYPTGVGDGVLIYDDTSDNYVYANLTYGDTWYFRAWGYVAADGLSQYSYTPAQMTMTVTGLPIAPVTFTVAMNRDGTITGNFTKFTPTTTIVVLTKFGTNPTNVTDGYEVFNSSVGYGFILPGLTAELYADGIDTTANFFSSPVWMSRIRYSAWARNSFGDSPTYTQATLSGSDTAPITTALSATLPGTLRDTAILFILGLIASGLLVAMFITRNWMLGFPAAIFWFSFGAVCYSHSTAAWDIWFLIAFASLLGMGTFSMYSAFGLREKKDTKSDKGEYIDENPDSDKFYGETKRKDNPEPDGDGSIGGEDNVSKVANRVRERAKQRRINRHNIS